MNNNYNTQRRLNENIRVHLALDKKYGNESTSSDSDFSDGYDRRLDDEFNAMITQARMKQKVKQEHKSFEELEEDGMARKELLQNYVAVIKHDNEYGQAEITKNAQSGEIVITNELNLPVPETILENVSSGNVDIMSDDRIVNSETIIAEVNNRLERGTEVEVVFNAVEKNLDFTCDDSLPIEDEEYSELDSISSILHSTARQSMMPSWLGWGDSNWTDCESDMSETTTTKIN